MVGDQALERQTRAKMTHARTQSELPLNVKLHPGAFVTATKKSNQLRDSPLFEKDSQSSEKEDSAANPTPPVESAASLNSNFKSRHESGGSHLPGATSAQKSSKTGAKRALFLDEKLVVGTEGLSKPDLVPFPDYEENPKTVPKKTEGLLEWPPVPKLFDSRKDFAQPQRDSAPVFPDPFRLEGSLQTLPGPKGRKDQLQIPSHNKNKERLLDLASGPADPPTDAFSPDAHGKRPSFLLKLELDARPARPTSKLLENLLTDFPRTHRQSAEALETSKRFFTSRELLEINADLFDRTHRHNWLKIDCPELGHPFELFSVANKKSLSLADSKPAHLDVIRRVEFAEDPVVGLVALTFSEDATIRTWKVNFKSADTAVLESPQRLPPHHSRHLPGLTGNEMPSHLTYQTSRRQFGKAASFLLMEGQKAPLPKLKRGGIFRVHTGSIFSSCVSRPGEGPVRVYSGDRLGTVNCFDLENATLKFVRSIRTGSEPVWALDLLDPDLLVTSSPNKLKVFRVSKASDRREEVIWENKTGLFGAMKTLDGRTLIANSYDPSTLSNDFIGFDAVTQSESFRIPSSQQFCNAMAVLPAMGILISANEDKTVSIYDTREHCQTNHFNAHSDSVTCVSVCANQNLFVTGGADSSVRLWDLRSLRIHNVIHGHRRKFDDSIFDVTFDPAGRVIGSGGAEGTLKIFQF